MLDISLKLEPTKEIHRKILEAVADQFTSLLTKKKDTLNRLLHNSILDAIRKSPEYLDLASGEQLYRELGVPDIISRLERILLEWVQSFDVRIENIKRQGNTYRGGLKIVMMNDGWASLTLDNDAIFVTEKGDSLNWLRWLLIEGDKVIVRDYEIGIGRGRTGYNIMIQNVSSQWRVPPQYAGTTTNNFITRSIRTIHSDFERDLKRELNAG